MTWIMPISYGKNMGYSLLHYSTENTYGSLPFFGTA